MAPLNEYERARAERIAANNAKMMVRNAGIVVPEQ